MSITFAHLNVRSLVSYFNSFKHLLLKESFEAMTISESWLNPGFDSNLLAIDGYNFYHIPRPTRGGGLAFYLKQSFNFSIIYEEISESIEQLWFKFTLRGKFFSVGVIYRPGSNITDFLDRFEESLTGIVPLSDEVFILGDFNINAFNFISPAYSRLTSILDSLNLIQLITEPTRVTAFSATLIDLIITCADARVGSSGVRAVHDVADHSLVFCSYLLENYIPVSLERTFRDYSLLDYNEFLYDLRAIPWFLLYEIVDVNDKLTFFNDSINMLFDVHAPYVTRRFNAPHKPWLTDNVRYIKHLRNKMKRRFERTGCSGDLDSYRQLRNYATFACRYEKKCYLRNSFQAKDSKKLWKDLRQANIHTGKNNSDIPSNLNNVNEINNYFLTVLNNNTPDPNLLQFYINNSKDILTGKFEFAEVTEVEVLRVIDSISSLSIGNDGISIKMIKLCCPFLLPFITYIINYCLLNAVFPTCWKDSIVIPIPKIKNPSDYSDLRPISITSVLSKIFEKIAAVQLREHLEQNCLLPVAQSGFRRGYGCSGALLQVVDDVIRASDNGLLSLLVLLDYSKAFDTISHELLLAILHYIGLGDSAVTLFANYLSERRQQVRVHNDYSNFRSTSSGVPQGSILGPILFIIYTCNLYSCLEYCRYHAYADDTQLYFSFSESQLQESVNKINHDLSNLVQFSTRHNLQINPNKSSVVFFGNRKSRDRVKNDLMIIINDTVLPISPSAKKLGFNYRF